jgi:hypothetical protein
LSITVEKLSKVVDIKKKSSFKRTVHSTLRCNKSQNVKEFVSIFDCFLVLVNKGSYFFDGANFRFFEGGHFTTLISAYSTGMETSWN